MACTPQLRGRRSSLILNKKNKSGICFLQVSHLCAKEHEKLCRLWGGQIFYSSFISSSRGECILVKKRVPFRPKKIETDSRGCYMIKGRMFRAETTGAIRFRLLSVWCSEIRMIYWMQIQQTLERLS